MRKTVFINGQICDGEKILEGHVVIVEDGVVLAVSRTTTDLMAHPDVYDLQGHLLAPGFVDVQVNGGGGELFNNAPTLETLKKIARAHRRFGTTGFLPTVISDTTDVMQAGIAAVAEALRQKMPGILGIHLEGPCLNSGRKGVHAEQNLRQMDNDLFELLTSLGSGTTMVTLAPEMLDVARITELTEAGVIVFAGHSVADFDQTNLALGAGIRGFTHLFNAMPALLSREPGIVGAALKDTDSYCGIIADGFHVHPATFAIALAAKKRGRVMLVTDAMASIGTNLDSFRMYGETISVTGGRCLNRDGKLAGSALNMQDAVKNAIKFADLDVVEALRMASTYPAHCLRRSNETGYIKSGYLASFVELDLQLNVVESWIDGCAMADED